VITFIFSFYFIFKLIFKGIRLGALCPGVALREEYSAEQYGNLHETADQFSRPVLRSYSTHRSKQNPVPLRKMHLFLEV
jgi:hypothetical protein